jgi:hypothetical protein
MSKEEVPEGVYGNLSSLTAKYVNISLSAWNHCLISRDRCVSILYIVFLVTEPLYSSEMLNINIQQQERVHTFLSNGILVGLITDSCGSHYHITTYNISPFSYSINMSAWLNIFKYSNSADIRFICLDIHYHSQ